MTWALCKVERLEMNGIHQLLIYTGVNLLGKNINTIKKTEILYIARKEGDREVNAKKIKYIFILLH